MNLLLRSLFLRLAALVALLAMLAGAPFAGRAFLAAPADLPLYLPLVYRDLTAQPPAQTLRLVFIHHSTGENWLRDDYGGLGQALAANNYFVSDTNYGWGPNAIGDRTDIPNWPEWFRSADTAAYMAALYAEAEQHAEYTRLPANPSGENRVVLFKSCFPNSMLEGSPNDPPAPGDGLTVSNAKYIYNDLLNYFRTRPDKLFIVITAPPVTDPSLAANARAFNNWLVNDWLQSNNYPYPNVAVFDFYNVLTHRDNHHRFENGQVQHIIANQSNTLYYPSGDDHPNEAGSQKASAEFLPLLNLYVERWLASAPPAAAAPTEAPAEPPAAGVPAQPPEVGAPPAAALIDDFETDRPPGSSEGWTPYWDEALDTRAACGPQGEQAYAGNGALQVDFDIAPGSWQTCAFFYDPPVDWSAATGLAFYIHASAPGLWFDVDLYQPGPDDSHETYYHSYETTPEMAAGWVRLEVPWSDLRRAEWEAPGGELDLSRAAGLSLGFGAPEDARHTGQVWIDDLQLLGLPQAAAAPGEPPAEPIEPTAAPVGPTATVGLPATESPAGAPVDTPPPAADGNDDRPQLPCLAPLGLATGMVLLNLKTSPHARKQLSAKAGTRPGR